jgi:hypothetical protein
VSGAPGAAYVRGMLTRRTVTGSLLAALAILAIGAGVAAAAHTGFRIHKSRLTVQSDGSWTGPGMLDGVKGTLTLTGKIVVLNQEMHKIQFTWKAGKRVVSGCSYNEILTRPHGTQLWDGVGQITKTSKQERKYQSIHVYLSGPTKRNDLTHATITIGASGPLAGQPNRNC